MATLSDIRSRVKFHVGNKTGHDTQIDDNINDAIIEYVLTRRPQEVITSATATTSNQTASYSFSSAFSATDVLAILFVRNDTDDYRLKRGSLGEYVKTKHSTSASSNFGRPNKWARQGNNLLLYSLIPDSTSRTVRLYYLQRPAELTSDSDTFPLNREHEQPVTLLAAAKTWTDLNNSEKAGLKYQAYQAILGTREEPEAIEDESPEVQMVPVANTR